MLGVLTLSVIQVTIQEARLTLFRSSTHCEVKSATAALENILSHFMWGLINKLLSMFSSAASCQYLPAQMSARAEQSPIGASWMGD